MIKAKREDENKTTTPQTQKPQIVTSLNIQTTTSKASQSKSTTTPSPQVNNNPLK